jgi:hypothetical protein
MTAARLAANKTTKQIIFILNSTRKREREGQADQITLIIFGGKREVFFSVTALQINEIMNLFCTIL